MTTSIIWDKPTLIPAEVGLFMRPNNTSGGVSLDGKEQVIGNTPGRWAASFKSIDIRTPASVLAWDALSARLRGRANPLLIPIYEQNQGPALPTTAVANVLAAKSAVSIDIKISVGSAPVAGQKFADITSECLYMIGAVTALGGSPPVYRCSTWPPIRQNIILGASLEFNDPYFRVRLASDNEMDLSLELRRFASPSVNFVEDV